MRVNGEAEINIIRERLRYAERQKTTLILTLPQEKEPASAKTLVAQNSAHSVGERVGMTRCRPTDFPAATGRFVAAAAGYCAAKASPRADAGSIACGVSLALPSLA